MPLPARLDGLWVYKVGTLPNVCSLGSRSIDRGRNLNAMSEQLVAILKRPNPSFVNTGLYRFNSSLDALLNARLPRTIGQSFVDKTAGDCGQLFCDELN